MDFQISRRVSRNPKLTARNGIWISFCFLYPLESVPELMSMFSVIIVLLFQISVKSIFLPPHLLCVFFGAQKGMWRSKFTKWLTSFYFSQFLGLCPRVGCTSSVAGNIPRLHRIYYVHHTCRILCHFVASGADVCVCDGDGGVDLLNLIVWMIYAFAL